MRIAGTRLFTGAEDGLIKRWDLATWQPAGKPLDAGEGSVLSLAVAHDGATLIAGYRSGGLVIWDVAAGVPRHRIGGRSREHGSCDELGAQQWIDDAHRARVTAACTSPPEDFLARFAARSHQRIDRDVDVVTSW